jgi:hypothetical protein
MLELSVTRSDYATAEELAAGLLRAEDVAWDKADWSPLCLRDSQTVTCN